MVQKYFDCVSKVNTGPHSGRCPWPPDKKAKKLNIYSKYLFTSGLGTLSTPWRRCCGEGEVGGVWGKNVTTVGGCPLMKALELLMGRSLGHPTPKDVWGLAVEGPRKRSQWTFPGCSCEGRAGVLRTESCCHLTAGQRPPVGQPMPPCWVVYACLTRQSCVDSADQPAPRDDCQGTVSGL